jgi:hypothetical protein
MNEIEDKKLELKNQQSHFFHEKILTKIKLVFIQTMNSFAKEGPGDVMVASLMKELKVKV